MTTRLYTYNQVIHINNLNYFSSKIIYEFEVFLENLTVYENKYNNYDKIISKS